MSATIKQQKTKADKSNRVACIATKKLQEMLTNSSTRAKYKDKITHELRKRKAI